MTIPLHAHTRRQDPRRVAPTSDTGVVLEFPKSKPLSVAEAWKLHGDDIETAAAAAGYSTITAFRNVCKAAGVDLGKFAQDADDQPDSAFGEPWSNPARVELADLWLRRPMLPVAEISRRIGRTTAALQTVVSRLGLPGRETIPLDALAAIRRTGRLRGCMTCQRQFFSTGPEHRLCDLHRRGDGLP